MDIKILYGIIAIAVIYSLYRFLTRPNKEFEKELDTIINSKEYKTKSQYD